MAKNWTAYEAAKEIYGESKENIAEIGSRYPLFARTVAMANTDYILDILKALPKVTARVVETGLKEMETDVEADADAVEDVKETKAGKGKKPQKTAVEDDFEDDENETDYESMTAKALYALCCERGISSHCKSRSKQALIDVLKKHDAGELEESGRKAKKSETKAAKATKKAEPVEDDADDWDDDEDGAEDSDPYAGKTAKELFTMCKERGIKVKPKQSADAYAKLLKDYDMNDDTEDEEDDDDEWEI